MSGDGRVAEILRQLRDAGTRVTTSRRVVIEELVARDREHLSADQLAARVQASYPEVHLATVYRTLELLERLGIAVHVHLGHGPSLFHLTDHRHNHAVCDRCGRVEEVPAAVVAPVEDWLARERGFAMAPHHFAMAGLCVRCRKES